MFNQIWSKEVYNFSILFILYQSFSFLQQELCVLKRKEGHASIESCVFIVNPLNGDLPSSFGRVKDRTWWWRHFQFGDGNAEVLNQEKLGSKLQNCSRLWSFSRNPCSSGGFAWSEFRRPWFIFLQFRKQPRNYDVRLNKGVRRFVILVLDLGKKLEDPVKITKVTRPNNPISIPIICWCRPISALLLNTTGTCFSISKMGNTKGRILRGSIFIHPDLQREF